MSVVAEANIVPRRQHTDLEARLMDEVVYWIDEASRHISLGALDKANRCLVMAKRQNAALKRLGG